MKSSSAEAACSISRLIDSPDVKLRPGQDVDGAALARLVEAAYADMKQCVVRRS
jgi:hypothetical protein